MKILMINKFFYRRGGSETYMFNLKKNLKSMGHQVIEFSMNDEKNEASEFTGYFIKNINFSKKEGILKDLKKVCHLLYSTEAKNKLAALIKKEKPDIAHLHNIRFQLTPAIIKVLNKYNIPVVWTMHDYQLVCPNYLLFTQNKVCERCKKYKFYNCFKYNCLKNSRPMSFLAMLEMYLHKIILKSYAKIDLLIAPSKFMQSKLEEWGIEASKIKQLYYSLDLKKSGQETDLGQGLLYFGRLSKEKGLETLLAAMKDLPNINLKIVGEGPQEALLLKYIEANNLKNVELLGYKSGEELNNIIKSARFVVLPSIWYENNPLAILEAFSQGKPVIGSDLGGIPELVQENKTGFLFEPGNASQLKDKIQTNYQQSELIKQMGQNAMNFVAENCSPEYHGQQIEKFYQNLKK